MLPGIIQCWQVDPSDQVHRDLKNTLVCSKALPGAGAATARCMAACMELLAWTQLTQVQGTPAWWQEPHYLWNKHFIPSGHVIMVLLVLCRGHWEGLDSLLLGHWLPNTVYLLLASIFSSFLACSLGIVQTPAASCARCTQLWRCIVLGFPRLRLACYICTPSHSPTLALSSL